jgi:hypothetical protein
MPFSQASITYQNIAFLVFPPSSARRFGGKPKCLALEGLLASCFSLLASFLFRRRSYKRTAPPSDSWLLTPHFNFDHPSSIPNPNKAKSYLTGSSGSSFRRLAVSSNAVCQSVCLRRISFSLLPTRSTCRSHGQTNCAGWIVFQMPKSTPFLSWRTIHRRYMLSLLQVDLRSGDGMCLRVRCGASGRLKNSC